LVTLNKTWSGPNQAAFTSSSDQAVQYRQACYSLKTFLLSGGWTVERSSNGTTADGNDNWDSVSDIVFGTEASQAHSWISLIAPTGKGNPSGGSNYRLLLNCDNSNADTTPQTLVFYIARGTYTGGSTTTRPTITGVEDTALTINFIPWTTATGGSICTWYTDDGDVYVGHKADGDTFFRFFWMIRDDLVDSRGNYTMTMSGWTNATSDVVTLGNMTAGTNWRHLRADGSGPSTRALAHSIAFDLNSWPSGAEGSSGRRYWRDVEILANGSTSADARDMGLLVDVRGTPANTAWMIFDQDDDGASAPFEMFTIGDLVIPGDSEIT